MQEMDFYELSRGVQDRFTVSIRGEGQPRPLLAVRAGPPREVLIWSAVGAAALALIILLFNLGFGDLTSDFAVQSVPFIAVYALLAGAVALSTLHVGSRMTERCERPYTPGIYLFPAGVVDAKSHELRVFPLSRLVTPTVHGSKLSLAFPEGETFSFPLAVEGHEAEVRKAIEDAETAVEKAHAAGDKKHLGALDPLVDIGVVNPFAPTERLAKLVPVWARQRWPIAVVAGLVLAPAF